MTKGDMLYELQKRIESCNSLISKYDPDVPTQSNAIYRISGKREAYRHAKEMVKDITDLSMKSYWSHNV